METREYEISSEELQQMAVDQTYTPDTAVSFGPSVALYAKLVKVMAEVGVIQKDGVNTFHNYRYMSDAALKLKVQHALIKNGLVSFQRMRVIKDEWVETRNGEKSNHVLVSCTLLVADSETGETESVTSLGSGSDKGDKAVMKAQTAAHKYAWSHMLNISTGDDPEADTTTDADHSTGVSVPAEADRGASGTYDGPVYGVKKKTANPASPWVISTNAGDFSTFNKDIATSAELALSTKLNIVFDWTRTEYRGNYEYKIVDPKKEAK